LIVFQKFAAEPAGAGLGKYAGPLLAGDRAVSDQSVVKAKRQNIMAVTQKALTKLAGDDLDLAKRIQFEIGNNSYSHDTFGFNVITDC